MGAYLTEIVEKCADCGRQARVRLFNRWNQPLGDFCRRCGTQRLKNLKKAEADDAARAAHVPTRRSTDSLSKHRW